ncbi:MAG TPA: SRPBCC family protein [Chitinophagaceae bacterium]|nr:SRPBCC family protein [Chitinophagales bacterium]HRX92561.1 SRPBCC family protein [Chitinophagaceae bacterium]
MKGLRLFLFFLLAVILIVAGMTFFLPVNQKIQRTVIINAPANIIFDELKKLENFNHYSVWGQQDSSVTYSIQGTDGTVGASTSWKGDPSVSGEGSISITELIPGRKIGHSIKFISPRKGNATSVFNLNSKEEKVTEVEWLITISTPRPKNIFNLFFSFDKQLGGDVETGLNTMKAGIELLYRLEE